MRRAADREMEAKLRLLQARSIGPAFLKALAENADGQGKSAAEVLEAGPRHWKSVAGMGPRRVAELEKARRAEITIRPPDGWDLLWLYDKNYPRLLRETAAPPLLWVFGRVDALSMPSVAVVGTRRCSDYGRRMAHRLGLAVAEAGGSVVSGLAYGIDAAAHRGALDAQGTTVAVLGCGPGQVYPAGHEALQERIARTGALVSEFLPGEAPCRGHFPRRNRVISGLSRATVVVEAFEKGGALITAATATEQDRDIFAVPGRADQVAARGSNMLIADGAGIVVSADDLVRHLREGGLLPGRQAGRVDSDVASAGNPEPGYQSHQDRTETERRILDVLKAGEETGEALAVKARILPRELWLALMRLESDQLVVLLPGGRYTLRSGR